MKILLLSAAFLFSSLILSSCKKDNPIPPDELPKINLTLEDTSCTEAWIKLSASNISLPANAEILKDDSITQIINLTTADTILYVDSLLPNHSYKFQSIIQSISQSSNSLNITTMDTTSHNFTWQTYTFGGQAGSCTLYDCAIVNENNIWAVGEIYLLDSLGQPDPQAYGISRWDGQNWNPKKIFYNNNIPVTPRGILIIDQNDIYLASGSIFHWDGVSSTVQLVYSRLNLPNPNGTIEKLWGNSEKIYGVGNAGTIVTYQNGQWSRIESGTDLNINDIFGAYNYETKEWEILAPASNILQSLDRELLSIKNNSVEHLNTAPITGTLRTVWFIPDKTYLLGGGGIFRKVYLTDSVWESKHIGITIYSTNKIRGNAINDIVLTGGSGEVLHYNGYSFKSYFNQTQVNGNYYSVDIKNDIIVTVGENNSTAVVAIGMRSN
jgi:hypothetical protein